VNGTWDDWQACPVLTPPTDECLCGTGVTEACFPVVGPDGSCPRPGATF
jgi:hypothetical protein